MSVAAGGKIKQVIWKDPHPESWAGPKTTVFNVQVLNSALYKAVTGSPPPMLPMDAQTYKRYGFPFFAMYEEPSGVFGEFSLVKSVAQIDKVNEEEVEPSVVQIHRNGDKNAHSGMIIPASIPACANFHFSFTAPIGITNPAGPLREFRTVSDIEKELQNFNMAIF